MDIAQISGTSTPIDHHAEEGSCATGSQAIHRVPVEVWQNVLECDQQTPPSLVRLATGRGAAGHGLRQLAKAAKADSLMRRYTPPATMALAYDKTFEGKNLLRSFLIRTKQGDEAAVAAIRRIWDFSERRIRYFSFLSSQSMSSLNTFFAATQYSGQIYSHPDFLVALPSVHGDSLWSFHDSKVLAGIDNVFKGQLMVLYAETAFYYRVGMERCLKPSIAKELSGKYAVFWDVAERPAWFKECISSAFAGDLETAISLIRYAPALSRYLPETKWEANEQVWWAAINRRDQNQSPCQHVPPRIGARADYLQKLLAVHGAKVHKLAGDLSGTNTSLLLTLVPKHVGVLEHVHDPAIYTDSKFGEAAIAANANAFYYLDSDYSKNEATVAAVHAAGLIFNPDQFAAHRQLYKNDNLLLSLAKKKCAFLPEIIAQSQQGIERDSVANLLCKNRWFLSAALDLDDYGEEILSFISSNLDEAARSNLFDRKMRLFLAAYRPVQYVGISPSFHDEQHLRVMSHLADDMAEFLRNCALTAPQGSTLLEPAYSKALFSDLTYALAYLRSHDFSLHQTIMATGHFPQMECNPLLLGLRDLLNDEGAVMELATMDPRIVRVVSPRLVGNHAFFQQLLQACAKLAGPQPVQERFLAQEKPEDLAWARAKLLDRRFDAPTYDVIEAEHSGQSDQG